jgi:hypothetical protein
VHEERFSAWRPWAKRNDHEGITRPGIYVIAHSSGALAGCRFSWRKDVIYVGMTNAKAGLKGRLNQFDRTMAGKLAHGERTGAVCTAGTPGSAGGPTSPWLFECDPESHLAKDLRTMGDVAGLSTCVSRTSSSVRQAARVQRQEKARSSAGPWSITAGGLNGHDALSSSRREPSGSGMMQKWGC